MSAHLAKYLTNFAEPEINIANHVKHCYHQFLIVPVCNEPSDCITKFIAFLQEQHKPSILVLVINAPPSDETITNNQFMIALQSLGSSNTCIDRHRIMEVNKHLIIALDRYSPGHEIPRKQGVGLARKIGMDIGAMLYYQQKLTSPWLHTSDADAVLPKDYFFATQMQNIGACLYPFTHIQHDASNEVHRNTLLYELSLHSYVLGLSQTSSPFAYHTVGSTIAIHVEAYYQTRGFPKRSAAEDFYMLNKLVKTATVTSLKGPTIHLSSRESMRTPFGTGQSVAALCQNPNKNPRIFYSSTHFSTVSDIISVAKLKFSNSLNSCTLPQNIPDKIKQSLPKVLEKISQTYSDPYQRMQHFYEWFDAGKILQCTNHLKNAQLPLLTFEEWIKELQKDSDEFTFGTAITELEALAKMMREIPFNNTESKITHIIKRKTAAN